MSRHYLCLSISPINAAQLNANVNTDIDVLTIRKALQDALAELFGVTTAGTCIDILAVTQSEPTPPSTSTANASARERRGPWGQAVLRVHPSYVSFFSSPLS